MNYQVHITRTAERDLIESVNYIENVLKNPIAADRLLDIVQSRILSISENPTMYHVVDDVVLNSWGVRLVPINQYITFYTVSEDTKIVYVVRFLSEKRDWACILRQGIDYE